MKLYTQMRELFKQEIGLNKGKYRSSFCIELLEHMGMGLTFDSFSVRIGVSPRTLQTWLKTYPEFKEAKEMRYRPKLLVKGIQTGKTRTVGVIVPPYDSFWTEVLYGIQSALAELNHFFINTWCRHEDNEENYSRQLLGQSSHAGGHATGGLPGHAHGLSRGGTVRAGATDVSRLRLLPSGCSATAHGHGLP